ncbi:IS3 family transposase [Actinomadura coerulea]|uniref:IS3 family transposase n=1 Tax=Actinomadura coerulea TaxID=46159 RepID=UPI003443BD95
MCDEWLKTEVTRIHTDNYRVYGARKVWRQLQREGHQVARCTVERLMRELGLHGARRGRKIRTTSRDDGHERAVDLLRRDFTVSSPNRRWVTEIIHAIICWAASTTKRTRLVLDALDMALWRRDQAGHPAGPGLVHHSDAGSQYTSFRFTTHLVAAGIDASIDTVGDALDNALMESAIGLYKTELIKPRGPWKNLTGVELATAEYVDCYNSTRLHGEIGHVPPDEYEALHDRQNHTELQVTATA